MATWKEELADWPINPALTGGKGQGAAAPAGDAGAGDGAAAGETDTGTGGSDTQAAGSNTSKDGNAADKAGNGTPAAENGTKSSENGTTPADSGTEGAEKGDTGAEGEKPDEGEQTPEERHHNAELRKAREREQLRGELRQEMQSFLTEQQTAMRDELIRGLHLSDPYQGGKTITTQAEYDAFITARDREAADQALEGAGIDRNVIDSLIEQHPAVVAARKLAVEATQEKTRVLDEAAQKRFDDQLAEIQTFAPEIKTADDLMAADNYEEVRALVRGGASIANAWKAVNLDRIAKHEREAAAQATRNGIAGKEHLQSTVQGRGEGGLQIPTAVERKYRETYPELSDEEIKQKYESIVKMQKKRG